ncbi:MAG: DHHC zinc finger domain-containing protein [Spirulina sp. SIO3F2]|nr:DHHC zinc finger domain-containing protein [Spirulina sp. SIO3F2]
MPQSPSPLPRLNLAPKLQRPLSLWNPLDYLRLLYWVFFFPQALRWYVETFGTGYVSRSQASWRKGIKLLREDAVQRQLLLQGLVLTIAITLLICSLLTQFGITMPWLRISLGVAGAVIVNILIGLRGAITTVIIFACVETLFIIVWSFTPIVLETKTATTLLGLLLGWMLGMLVSSSENMDESTGLGFINGLVRQFIVALPVFILFLFGLTVYSLFYLILLFLGNVSINVFLSKLLMAILWTVTTPFILILISQDFFAWRLETWLASLLMYRKTESVNGLSFPRSTAIPLPQLTNEIQQSLRLNWEYGLEYCQDILRYSAQFIPVLNALKAELDSSPEEQLIWRVSRLAHCPLDWKVVALMSISFKQQGQTFIWLHLKEVVQFGKFSRDASKRINLGVITEPVRLDTLPRATAAGFWSLHEKDPAIATRAFNVVRHILYGEEMYRLAHNLYLCHNLNTIEQIQNLTLSPCPEPEPEKCLRPETWEAIASLQRVIEEAEVYAISQRPETRAQALARAQAELQQIVNRGDRLPEAEQALIIEIATQWIACFMQASGNLEIAIAY